MHQSEHKGERNRNRSEQNRTGYHRSCNGTLQLALRKDKIPTMPGPSSSEAITSNQQISIRAGEMWLLGSDCSIVRAHPHSRAGAAGQPCPGLPSVPRLSGCERAGTEGRTDGWMDRWTLAGSPGAAEPLTLPWTRQALP